jgi:signal transduction histidine kinase/HPt (histidine-containing phosphotransfer) domain-containing protein
MKPITQPLRIGPESSIRNKLVTLSFAFLLIIVGMVFALVFTQQRQLLQTQWAESMAAQARLLAWNMQAAIVFSDEREAHNLLSSLSVNPAIQQARVTQANGRILGDYQRAGTSPEAFPDGDHSPLFLDGYLVIREPIQLYEQNTPAGRIDLLVSLEQYHYTMRQTIQETALLLLLALTTSLLLIRYLVGRLTAPLEQLDNLANQISLDARLDARIATQRHDEIGSLGQSFDRMLDSLQARDRELAGYRESLESMVTERTEALQEAIAEAQRANRAKSDFLARMSHEIRTPMNAIVGLSHMVLDSPLPAQQREYIEQVVQSSDALLGLINDILDYSKVEAGSLTLENTPFDISSVFRSIAGLFSLKARSKGLTLSFSRADDVPELLQGDALRLGQILINLVSNALKFTDQGGIEVAVRKLEQPAENSIRLEFSVSDSGMGIPAEQQEKLFAPFSQADSSITRRFGGTGLGLAICRQLAHLMDGEIELESQPDAGSTFRFSAVFGLPAANATNPAEGANSAVDRKKSKVFPRWSGERVLLVEDIPVNRTIAIALLQRVGLSIGIATNGQEAIDQLDKEAFSLVLMDIQMPVLDGLSACRRIRADERFKNLPIIAMTAHATHEDQKQSLLAGMNAHVSKPIMPAVLYEEIARWLPPLSASEVDAVVEEAPSDWPALPGIDIQRGLVLHMNRPTFYLKSLHTFRKDFAAVDSEIQQAMNIGNTQEARRLAHSIKSVGGSLGAVELAEHARVLEQALSQPGNAAANLEQQVYDFASELQRVLSGLDTLPPASSTEHMPGSQPMQLNEMFDQLLRDLQGADAHSEAHFGALRNALSEQATAANKYEIMLNEITDLIEDLEYKAAYDQLQILHKYWRECQA